MRKLLGPAAVLLAATITLAACGSSKKSSSTATTATKDTGPVTLNLGYFPNVTHATAIAGVEKGIFAKDLGSNVTLKTATFNAGPAAVEALFSGAIDATYIGPNPAINAWSQSNGSAIKIISGATAGGAALVVKPTINSAADLKGKKIATPQLGNTQDVALRAYLKDKGLKTDASGGGDVNIVPQDNSQTLDTFKAGSIDGAWVPEPWVSRLVLDGGGKVLVDEKTLWPEGKFVTTLLVVRQAFLKAHPDVVKRLLQGQVDANDYVNKNPAEAQQVVNDGIGKVTGKKLSDAVIAAAWKNLTFTDDPIASSLKTSAQHAQDAGLLKPVNLTGIFDVSTLDVVLKAAGEPTVSAS
ncbi:MAG TPA: ABC transporter substrate-binding protein [Acidimicrobiales bacterium]|nr:ABC transporter substrate-binding protein [Acidimicrobiales bacterium]